MVYVLRGAQTAGARYFISLLDDLVANAQQQTALDIEVSVYDTTASLLCASTTMESLADWDNPFLDASEKKKQYRYPQQDSKTAVTHRAGRPNLATALNHLLNDARPPTRRELGGGVALAACGPHALIESARRAALACDQDMAYRA